MIKQKLIWFIFIVVTIDSVIVCDEFTFDIG